MSELTKQQVKAKQLMFDKLGPIDRVEKKVYHVENDW